MKGGFLVYNRDNNPKIVLNIINLFKKNINGNTNNIIKLGVGIYE